MLTVDEEARYARQIVIPEIGKEGQEKLKSSRVLIIGGAGGLGSPSAMYLACAGVGTIGIVDETQSVFPICSGRSSMMQTALG